MRGLPGRICPECGRSFDPADQGTFDTRPPGWRRRRWIKRGVVAGVVGALLFVLCPRGIMTARVTFTCLRCGEAVHVTRWQLKPPPWFRFRYPGLHHRTTTPVSAGPNKITCDNHQFDYAIRSDLPIGGFVTASANVLSDDCTINGMPFSVDSAPRVLRGLLTPGNNGIGP